MDQKSKQREELKSKGLLWNSTNMGGGYIMQCHLKGFMRQLIMGKRIGMVHRELL